MTPKKRPLQIAIILMAVLIVLAILSVERVIRERHRTDQRLVHLLCETDYQGLLNACRELSKRVAAGGLESKTYVLRSNLSWFGCVTPDPKAASFPKAILDADPVLVEIHPQGRVWLALYVYPNQGLFAYPEDHQAYLSHLGDVELIPGLWFSDDHYRSDLHPEFVRYVDGLIEKGKDHQRSMRESKSKRGHVLN